MSDIALEFLIILLLVLANGVFAMSEIAVVTARKGRLERRAAAGDRRARAALELAAEPTQFLSTVQVGITLIGIIAGAFGGATLAEELDARLEQIGWLAPYSGAISFALVVAVITYLSLVLGELVPKRLAMASPERIATRVATSMRSLGRMGGPVVRLLTGSTNAVLRLFGVRASNEPSVTEEDIRALIAQGAESGAIQEMEEDILERVFRLGDRPVGAIMTPRPDLDWIDASAPSDVIRAQLARVPRSRYLVCEDDVDRVLGIVCAKELLAQCLSEAPLDLRGLVHQPQFVPDTMPVLTLLETFRQSEVQVALALDEFGGVQGVVTLNDVLEHLVSDIPGRLGASGTEIVRREDGSWLMDAALPLDAVEETLGLPELTLAERPDYRTLGGLVMTQLGRLPREGDHFVFAGFRFEVIDMDGRRIDRVLVSPAKDHPS